MRTIIAGSRSITDYEAVQKAVSDSGFVITEAVSGCCRGVDRLGERWAEENGVPVKLFPADWHRHGPGAGPIRNREMAEYADALILVWDGRSRGSRGMLEQARVRELRVFERVLAGG